MIGAAVDTKRPADTKEGDPDAGANGEASQNLVLAAEKAAQVLGQGA